MTSNTSTSHWLAELVRTPARVETDQELTDVLLEQAAVELDLSTVWLFIKLPTDDEFMPTAAVIGSAAESSRERFSVVPISGDAMPPQSDPRS